MRMFDTHCHIDTDAFDADRTDVLRRTRAVGVSDLLVPAIERAAWRDLLELCAIDPGLHPAIGLHPVFMHKHTPGDAKALAETVERHRPAAVGEIGLDWQVAGADRDAQQRLLDQQLEVAEAANLPVVLHVRKAHDQMLNTLRRYRLPGGFCHAFNGSLQQADRYQALGFRLGFGGMLTFERSSHLRKLARQLPLEAIVLETDAPDMTVAAHRFERNSPEYLPDVLHVLAGLRGAPAADIAERTHRNARATLNLPDIATSPT